MNALILYNNVKCFYVIVDTGKTHTVSGSPSDPGLLPRMLDVVFNSVQDGKLLTEVKFKPKHYSEVSYLDPEELVAERTTKKNILAKVQHTHCTFILCSCIHSIIIIICFDVLFV